MYLKRYHDIEVSKSGVWRILKRLDPAGSRPPSGTSATTASGSGMRSRCPGMRCRSM